MTILDSNVLVYAVDARDAGKQKIAKAIVMSARDSAEYVISAQVLNEFSNVAMRKLGKTRVEVMGFAELFKAIRSVPVKSEWTMLALEMMGLYDLQFYDALLLVAAKELGCDRFLTEDLSDGQTYSGILAVNPFRQ